MKEQQKMIHNFTVRRVRKVSETGGTLWELEHEKSGARLVWQERPDENKTFAIAFKTVPEDSTGVFHILEHSVLCGSEKFPVKQPLVELMKGSLNTFLNAMTFRDKTVFPVSSRNQQDFLNLVSVYMDAVLHPAFCDRPERFRQEGWRYELRAPGEPAVYQGVVYNEMKGAYSSVSRVLEQAMNRCLFPDTCYRHDSGGDPEHIPELTYERFLACHKKFYHPSNALIVLDGDLDLAAVLALLDSYLSAYGRREADISIPMQRSVPYHETEVPYEIGSGEDPREKTIVSFGRLLSTFADQKDILAAQILADYLAGDSQAPLKRAVLSAGLGRDVKVRVHSGVQQPWVSWEVWNTDQEKLPEIKRLIRDTLSGLTVGGLDRGRLEGACNRIMFSLLDRDSGDYPRGVMEVFAILESWLYGGDPAQNLMFRNILDELEAETESGYFENVIRRGFLDDTGGALVCMVPSRTLGDESRRRETERLTAVQAAWTPEKFQQIQADNEALAQWQHAPDTEAALAAVPLLKLPAIPEKPSLLSVEKEQNGQTTVLRYGAGGGLAHLNLYFFISDLAEDELPYAAVLCDLLGKLPTASHDSAELQMLLKQKIGSLSFSPEVYSIGGRLDRCRVCLAVRCACLEKQKDCAVELIREILTETRFQDSQFVQNILRQARMSGQMKLTAWGNQYAATRVAAYQTSAGAAKEYLSGVEYIRWLKDQCGRPEEHLDELLDKLATVAGRVFTRERLMVSGVSANVEDTLIRRLTMSFPTAGEVPSLEGAYKPLGARREGIVISSGVAFAVKGSNLNIHGRAFPGRIPVLSKLISLGHLWNAIRVQGGAYAAGFYGNDAGDVTFYTFRDPEPARSLECFDRSAAFLRDFCAQGGQLDRFIVGSVADIDPPLGTEERMKLAERRFIKGMTDEYVCRLRQELLSTTPKDLLDFCEALDAVAADELICVVGGRTQLDVCSRIPREGLMNLW